MMRSIFIWMCLFLMLVGVVSASDGGVSGQEVVFQADIFDQPDYYNANNATATIYYPNGTVYLSNLNLTKVSTGLYTGNFTPNVSGNWYIGVEYYNVSGKIATASQSLEIRSSLEVQMEALIVMLGLCLMAIIFIYAAMNIKSQEVPRGRVWEKVLWYALVLVFVLTGAFFMKVFVDNSQTLDYMAGAMNLLLIVVIGICVGIVMFFGVYQIENVFKMANMKKGDDDFDKEDD